ncbi:MAG: alpha-amylase, partial [Bacteroidota bacterium]
FRNTELIYSERLLPIMDRLGFQGLVTEGVDRLLIGRSPHHVFQPNWHRDIEILLRDYMRSDDIAFRYTDREWEHHPLEVETFAQWIDETEGEVINIFMDYETLGEHQGGETGIFRFLEDWITYTLQENLAEFVSPSQLIRSNVPSHFFTSKEWISWADTERDLSAWNGNEMQQEALAKIQELRQPMQATSRARANPQIWDTWHYLTQSDHFYYMATKEGNDGEVHQYFSPFTSPHAAYLHYMNVIAHIQHQLSEWSRD